MLAPLSVCIGIRGVDVALSSSLVLAMRGMGCGRVVLPMPHVVLAVELALWRPMNGGMGRGMCSSELEALRHPSSSDGVVLPFMKGGRMGMLDVANPGRVVLAMGHVDVACGTMGWVRTPQNEAAPAAAATMNPAKVCIIG